MRIHNLYSDILRSLTYLFDNFIFGASFIKKYIFNIANYSFQLTYETQFELPTVTINLNESTPVNLHPTNIQRIGLTNINRIPVIYNRTKDLTIELQEEHYLITLDVVINCESQFQAKDVEFRIQSVLPLNKWIYIHRFTSFIEIDSDLLIDDILNMECHDLVNTYLIYDYNRATNMYAFAINYQPLMRLTNIGTNIELSADNSFTVNLGLELLVQFPQYLFIPYEDRPRSDQTRQFIYDNIIVNISDEDIIYFELDDNDYVLAIYQPELKDINYNSAVTINYFKSTPLNTIIKGKVEWISDQYNRFPLDTSADIKITKDYLSNKIKLIELTGILTGHLKNIKESDNLISGIFTGTYMHKPISDTYLELKYSNLLTYTTITYDKFPFLSTNQSTRYIRLLPKTRKLLSTVPKINENRADINLNNTILKSIICKDLSTNFLFEIPINKSFTNNLIITTIEESHTIHITYDNESKLLNYSISTINPDYQSIPVALNFSPLHITAKPTYGGTYIERISVTLSEGEFPISPIFVTDQFDYSNPELDIYHKDTKTVFRYILDAFTSSNDDFFIAKIETTPVNLTSYSDLKLKLINQYYRLDHTFNQDQIYIDTVTDNSITIFFDKKYFLSYFKSLSKTNPLFIEVYTLS